MTAESDAKRIAAGPPPSVSLPADNAKHRTPASSGGEHSNGELPPGLAPYDPLRLCIYATVALLGWLAGPVALLVFSAVGALGYARARRAGLKRSRCFLRDTRLVLAYFTVLIAVGAWGTFVWLTRLVGG